MKPIAMFWCGLGGLSSILLLGQLFADYEQIREGVMRLFGLIALGVFSVSGLNILVACTNRTHHRQPIAPVVIASLIASGVLLVILILIAAIGGGR